MNKDVVYIDVEDDITAIIGKVRASREKIVALVPPKRVGVLQSAVNLRLLQRVAGQNDKRLVIITGDKALSQLSAAADIPVAKNLQSKPEIAEIPVLEVDDDDVIDGSQLPVGELEKTTPNEDDDAKGAELIRGVSLDTADSPKMAVGAAVAGKAAKKPSGKKKIPNFNSFRKRLFVIGGGLVVLVALLVWAFVFAPRATVVITAHTTPVQVQGAVTLGSVTDPVKGSVKAIDQTVEQEAKVEFAATGEKDVGEKARGTVRFSTGSISNLGTTIPAGTQLRASNGLTYQTTSAVTFSLSNYNGADAGVVAAESGEKYNGASGSVSGAPSGVSASFSGATSGGTTKVVAIVTAADVQSAKQKLVEQPTDAFKQQLAAKFTKEDIVLQESFVADRSDAVPAPAVGAEAPDKKATLTSKVVYRLSGMPKAELEQYVTQALKSRMEDQTTQKVYSTGIDAVKFTDIARSEAGVSVRLDTTGQIGPVIDENKVKEKVAGKQYGDVRAELTKIEGVSDVEVKFPYFWVRSVPNDPKKITIEFKVEGARG